MSRPRVDVIVPCHNYGRYLPACVASVLQERSLAVRVLIIDDASTDGSLGVARALAAGDRRVSVRAHAANQGHIATYNEGLAWADGDYLLLLSADDMAAPGALARAVEVMQSRPRLALVYGAAIRFSHDDELAAAAPARAGAFVMPGDAFIRQLCADARNPVETATAVVRTRVQKAVGDYRPDLPHAADLEMWLRCATMGEVGYVRATQGFVRIHRQNMRHAYGGQNLVADGLQRLRAFECFFRDHGVLAPEPGPLLRQVRRRIAGQLFEAAWEEFAHDRPFDRPLAAALRLAPGLRLRPTYGRMRAKAALRSALGPERWRRLQNCKAALRGEGAPGPPAPDIA